MARIEFVWLAMVVAMVVHMILAEVLIMNMRLIFVTKVGVNVELGIQIEATQIKHFCQRYLTKMHHLLWRARIHVSQAVLQRFKLGLGHQISLADENLIRKTHLPTRPLPAV